MATPKKALLEITKLLEKGHTEEVDSLLEKILGGNLHNPQSIYADAVNILLEARLYDKCIELFDRYENLTGKQLRTDFSRDEIIKEQQSATDAENKTQTGQELTFKRMSILERGHFSNKFRLFPVTEITVDNSGIAFKKAGKIHRYSWSDIDAARLTEHQAFKTYGKGTGARYLQRTISIKASGREFQFDISSNFPDFHNSKALESILKKHLALIVE